MLWLLEVSGVFTARRLENRIGKLKGCPETAGKLCPQVQPDSAKSKEPRVLGSLPVIAGSFREFHGGLGTGARLLVAAWKEDLCLWG